MLIAQMREYAILREDGAITTEPHLRLLEEHQAGLREQIARPRAHEKALATKIARRSCQPPISHKTEEPMNKTKERQQRFEGGKKMLDTIDDEAGTNVIDALKDISPELAHQVVAWGFGEIYSRPELEPRDRQLVTLGILTALGGCEPQLDVHINAALNVALTPKQITEALLPSAVYCEFPCALNATFTAKGVFAECGLLPVL